MFADQINGKGKIKQRVTGIGFFSDRFAGLFTGEVLFSSSSSSDSFTPGTEIKILSL